MDGLSWTAPLATALSGGEKCHQAY
jgi:hypothetical protein